MCNSPLKCEVLFKNLGHKNPKKDSTLTLKISTKTLTKFGLSAINNASVSEQLPKSLRI